MHDIFIFVEHFIHMDVLVDYVETLRFRVTLSGLCSLDFLAPKREN